MYIFDNVENIRDKDENIHGNIKNKLHAHLIKIALYGILRYTPEQKNSEPIPFILNICTFAYYYIIGYLKSENDVR